MRETYLRGQTFADYLDSVEKNQELWQGIYDRVALPEERVERARAIGGRWHLLAISEDWCGDAVNLLPVVARLVEAVPGLELRVLGRDDNPEVMDRYLTGGRSRSIPVVVILDEDFREVGWWGPRPREIQSWVLGHLDMPSGERYKQVRRWYARDRGRTTVDELLDLMESGAEGRRVATPEPDDEGPAEEEAA